MASRIDKVLDAARARLERIAADDVPGALKRGAVLVGYATLSSSTYPSAAYSYIDPSGNISPMQLFKSGEAPFRRERWGDAGGLTGYSAAAPFRSWWRGVKKER